MTDAYLQRFGGIARLYGREGLSHLHAAHVCVVGVGGVGSWVVEALARSGVGEMTLIDLDDVCITNTNRQLPALEGTVGLPKVSVLAQRVSLINPECKVHEIMQFITESNASMLGEGGYDLVIDAVDRMSIKTAIIAACTTAKVPVITCGSAGGRRDPTLIKIADLGMSGHDLLLQQVRRKLRRDHAFAKSTDGNALAMGVPCVYSSEKPVFAKADGTCSLEPDEDAENGVRLDCASGFGAATHVTGAFAFAAVSEALRQLVNK